MKGIYKTTKIEEQMREVEHLNDVLEDIQFADNIGIFDVKDFSMLSEVPYFINIKKKLSALNELIILTRKLNKSKDLTIEEKERLFGIMSRAKNYLWHEIWDNNYVPLYGIVREYYEEVIEES